MPTCRLRQGRAGGNWRHVRNVLQAEGGRTVFVDGKLFTVPCHSAYLGLEVVHFQRVEVVQK